MKKTIIALLILAISLNTSAQKVGIENTTVLLKYVVSKLPKQPKKADYVKILTNLPISISSKQDLIVFELRDLDNNEAAQLSKMIPGSTPEGIKDVAITLLDLLPLPPPEPILTDNTKKITTKDFADFGVLANGSHNDLPDIRNLLESLKSENSVLITIPGGTYYLNTDNNVKEKPKVQTEQVTGFKVTKNLVYGSNIDWKGKAVALKLDIYKPTTANAQSIQKYPLVVFMHGGGWSDGSKNRSSDVNAAKALAERGYAVASIDYRVGWRTSEVECENDWHLGIRAIYRSIQDLRASLRYVVSKADLYNFDTSNIYIMGSSAGAGSLLFNQFYTQEFWDTTFPIIKDLGKLDGATNVLSNKFTVKGLIPMWGGMFSTSAITKENAIPTLFIHGTADPVATIDVKTWLGCNRPLAYGSRPLYNRLVELGVPALAHFKTGGGHGVYTEKQWAAQADCFIRGIISKNYVTGEYYDNDHLCY